MDPNTFAKSVEITPIKTSKQETVQKYMQICILLDNYSLCMQKIIFISKQISKNHTITKNKSLGLEKGYAQSIRLCQNKFDK
jgi:hypothetical protein